MKIIKSHFSISSSLIHFNIILSQLVLQDNYFEIFPTRIIHPLINSVYIHVFLLITEKNYSFL